MSTAVSDRPSRSTEPDEPGFEEQVLPIFAESIAIHRERHETARVRATVTTNTEEQIIDEDLLQERVEVDRVPIGRVVDEMPPVREEDGTVIIPVVEEVLVVERRLVLKEEVHLRRVRVRERHVETVVVRRQEVSVTRLPTDDGEDGHVLSADHDQSETTDDANHTKEESHE